MKDQIFLTTDDSIKVVKDSQSKDIAEIRSLLHEFVENLAMSKPTPLEFRRLSGEDPELWISQAERYFEFYAYQKITNYYACLFISKVRHWIGSDGFSGTSN